MKQAGESRREEPRKGMKAGSTAGRPWGPVTAHHSREHTSLHQSHDSIRLVKKKGGADSFDDEREEKEGARVPRAVQGAEQQHTTLAAGNGAAAAAIPGPARTLEGRKCARPACGTIFPSLK